MWVKVIYVCEKVSILEQAALDHLAVAVIQRASEAVQDELIRLALEKQRIERSTQARLDDDDDGDDDET